MVYQDPLIGIPPLYLVAVAFITTALGLVIKSERFFKVFASVAMALALVLTLYVLAKVGAEGTQLYFFGGYPAPLGIAYEVDRLSALLGVVASAIMLLAVIYSVWYMAYPRLYLFYTLTATLLAGSLGCLYTGDYFNFFVMLEVLTLSSYALVAYFRDSPKAITAAIRYSFTGIISSSFYLLSAFIAYASFGTLNMADLAIKARDPASVLPFSGNIFGNILMASAAIIALTLWTWTFEAAIFPNYFWFPDSLGEAPTPVSAAFAAVVDVVGVYGAIRLFYTILGKGSVAEGIRSYALLALYILGAVTAIIASLLILVENDVKKFIAYSSVAHMGLLFMMLSLDTAMGISAAILYFISVAFTDALMFFSSGIAVVAVGRSIDDLRVLRRYREAVLGFVIALLNLVGLPPLIGFWGKYLMFVALLEKGGVIGAIGIIVLAVSTLLIALRYLEIIGVLIPPVRKFEKRISVREDPRLRNLVIPYIVIEMCISILIVLGVLYMAVPSFRDFIHSIGFVVTDPSTYYINSFVKELNIFMQGR